MMKTHTNLTSIATLIANPPRATILSELLGGMALTATELATRAGVAPSTASEHLALLVDGGLLQMESQGRHRYYRLADPGIAHLLESLGAYAPASGFDHARHVPIDLRFARTCYDHLAGHLGVAIREGLIDQDLLVEAGAEHQVTPTGERWFAAFGVDLVAARQSRRSFARRCLDWSERRPHLAGALGAAMLQRMLDLHLITRLPREREVRITLDGRRYLHQHLGIDFPEPGHDDA